AIYLICALSAPEAEDDVPIDLEAFYWRNRRLFYSAVMSGIVLALIGNAAFLKTPNPLLFLEENAATLPMIAAAGLPLAVPARWAQWAGGLALLAMMIGFTIVFSSTLK